jgi:hypothetical protein
LTAPILVIVGIWFAVSTGTGSKSKEKRSPEVQALLDKYNQIEEDLTEAQVDAVFAGYKGYRSDDFRPSHPGDGTPFRRPSAFSKMFCNGPMVEANYFVRVYFDDAGYVVGKQIGEFVR